MALIVMQLDVNIPAPFVPIFLPNNPDIIALNKGKNNTNRYIDAAFNISLLSHHELFVVRF